MSIVVTASVPARLHLGFLDLSGGAGRRFGSIGLPLKAPETVVSLSRSPKTVMEGPDAERAGRHLAQLCAHLGISAHHRLTVEEAIPSHIGLGSGTQLAVAVAAALRTLHGLPINTRGDAVVLGRGARSGIGLATFDDGGLIVDAGKSDPEAQPPIVARHPFPQEWRVLLIFDHAATGIHGEAEIEAFRALPPFLPESSNAICRHVLMGLLPAVVEHDIEAFGTAVEAIQTILGNHFAPAQGGIFTSTRVEQVARRMQEAGAVGLGQSSWGPTGFVFAPSPEAAWAIADAGRAVAEPGIEIRIATGRNEGATITHDANG